MDMIMDDFVFDGYLERFIGFFPFHNRNSLKPNSTMLVDHYVRCDIIIYRLDSPLAFDWYFCCCCFMNAAYIWDTNVRWNYRYYMAIQLSQSNIIGTTEYTLVSYACVFSQLLFPLQFEKFIKKFGWFGWLYNLFGELIQQFIVETFYFLLLFLTRSIFDFSHTHLLIIRHNFRSIHIQTHTLSIQKPFKCHLNH